MLRRVMVPLLLLVLVGVGAVLVGRAVRLPSRQITAPAVLSPPIDAVAAAQRLGKAIQFKTVSHQEVGPIDRQAFVGLRDYFVRTFPDLHRVLLRDIFEDLSLLYTWPGSDPTLPPLLLLGHLDVVPVEAGTESDWTYEPFSGEVADGYVWGRGTMDMKAAVLGSLEAVNELVRMGFAPRRTILLAFGHDEEIGGHQGATSMARHLAEHGVTPVMVLDEGLAVLDGIVPGVPQPMAMVGIAEKGYVTFELTAHAEGGHSSMPPRPTSAGLLGSALRALESHTMPAHFDGPLSRLLEFVTPELPFRSRLVLANLWLFRPAVQYVLDQSPPTRALIRTTFAPTVLEGSRKENVLPAQVRALVNVRIHPGDTLEEVEAFLVRTIHDDRITVRRLTGVESPPSGESPIDTDVYRLLHQTIVEVLPDVLVAPGLVLGATDSRHYGSLTPAVYRFLPLRVAPADTARIHGTNERVAVDNYGDVVRFYMRLMHNFGR